MSENYATRTGRRIVARLLDWFEVNARDLPWRKTTDPYAIWVSEIMLQQTQVKTVLPYWDRWMRTLPTVEALAAAPASRIHKLWEGLGYYARVRNMQKAAQEIIRVHNGEFPHEFEAVLDLPGIGRYTAGAICSLAFNQPAPILDGNIIRVLTRLFEIKGDPGKRTTNGRLWTISGELVAVAGRTDQKRACSQLNQSLMELGALVCVPGAPKCDVCPLQPYCGAYRNATFNRYPQLAPRCAPTSRRFAAFIARRRGRFLVRQRPAGIVNALLWEFPNIELQSGNGHLKNAAEQELALKNPKLDYFATIKHTITRYHITLDVFQVSGNCSGKVPAGKWLSLRQLKYLAFPSAHRRILERLM